MGEIERRALRTFAIKFKGVFYGPAEDVQVSVDKPGYVELTGTIDTYWDKLKVYEIVSRVDGVTTISNELVVDTEMAPDKMIKDEILDNMSRNKAILEPGDIQVNVNQGTVVLSGKANFRREALMVRGIQEVDNNLKVNAMSTL